MPSTSSIPVQAEVTITDLGRIADALERIASADLQRLTDALERVANHLDGRHG
ncbi:MAG: hypothetical protein M3003_10490 [Candidatus Dormibacteraeota bacterium]|nr:hypothetical protein [Candidatus Dormibacteraeota bacterium]